MKIIHEIKGMSGESEGRGTKEEENKGRYNDNKKLSAAIRREIQTAKHPSLYIYIQASRKPLPPSSLNAPLNFAR